MADLKLVFAELRNIKQVWVTEDGSYHLNSHNGGKVVTREEVEAGIEPEVELKPELELEPEPNKTEDPTEDEVVASIEAAESVEQIAELTPEKPSKRVKEAVKARKQALKNADPKE